MSDKYGLKRAAERGITLGKVGDKILLENEHIRMWEVKLEPGQTIDTSLFQVGQSRILRLELRACPQSG